jgi:hypothetical protein
MMNRIYLIFFKINYFTIIIPYIFPISLAIKINNNECGVPVMIAAVINALNGIVPSTPEP